MEGPEVIASTYGGGELPPDPSDNGLTASSGEEPALSVISDSLSEQEYSSDSGKGTASDSAVTPPDSVNETEGEEVAVAMATWQLFPPAYTAYSYSLGKVFPSHAMIYEFEIPQSIVGRLIGRFGSFLKKINTTTGANIIVKRHQNGHLYKTCAVEGVSTEIDRAISMIRERFPLKKFPNLSLEQTNSSQLSPSISFLPSNNKLILNEGVFNEVTVSCVVSLDHIFFNQPTHPTFPALSELHKAMKDLYDQPEGAPKLSRPFNPGVICVVLINKKDWYRAEVVAIFEEKDQVTVRLVDMGGYVQVPIESLRQIRVDFVSIPFQTTECRLANIMPINEEEGWSEEAVNFFKILAHGHVLQANVVGYSLKDNLTLIHLYKLTENHSHLFINEQLVTHGYAKWIDDTEYFILPEELEICEQFVELSTGEEEPTIENELSASTAPEECSNSAEELAENDNAQEVLETSLPTNDENEVCVS